MNAVVSQYVKLRRFVGVLSVLLPFLCIAIAAGNQMPLQSSLSAYYHTPARDFFVGILWAMGVFLCFYVGYDKHDAWAGRVAGVSAILVACLPTRPPGVEYTVTGAQHAIASIVFFAALAYFCLVCFVKGDGEPNSQKLKRNRLYRICGWGILICAVAIAALPKNSSLVFWAELVAILLSGAAWTTKGKWFLKDSPDFVSTLKDYES